MAKSSLGSSPLVSICIPAYNSHKYIRETLNCLCAQTYQNIEIIVVNDGSTDDTEAQVKSITDNRIKLINETQGGAAKARNTAYDHAKGEYVIFFDADDHIETDYILQQVKKINGRKDVVVVALWGRFYNDDLGTFMLNDTPIDEMTLPEWIKFYWYNCNPMTNPGRTIIPTGLVKKAGPWNESLSLNDDMEFYTRIFLNAEKIIFNHDATFYYRSGITGLSARKGDNAYRALYNSMLLSVNSVVFRYKNDPLLLKSCANMWQAYIYEVYPFQKKYLDLAKKEIDKLIKPDHKYMASGYSKYLVKSLGWKLTKRLKLALDKNFKSTFKS
jgi:glycosyltransferase involved in cell wall biosynthesis